MAERVYEYRKDGWPLCPECGDDELYSLKAWDEPACPSHPMACYLCSFTGTIPLREASSSCASDEIREERP